MTAVFPTETNPENLTADRLALKELASAHLGIIRRAEDLQNAQRLLVPLTPEAPRALSRPYLELQNMRLLVRLMLDAALARQESRGSHFRVDYPEPDPAWTKRIVLSAAGIDSIPADQPFTWPW